ncbi:MAG: hypothetical protein ACRYGK_04060 [Janthinobacterium lividum]
MELFRLPLISSKKLKMLAIHHRPALKNLCKPLIFMDIDIALKKFSSSRLETAGAIFLLSALLAIQAKSSASRVVKFTKSLLYFHIMQQRIGD